MMAKYIGIYTHIYEKIKILSAVVAGVERDAGRGRNSRTRGACEWTGPSGPSPQGVSHVHGTHSAEKPTSAPTNNYPYYPIL